MWIAAQPTPIAPEVAEPVLVGSVAEWVTAVVALVALAASIWAVTVARRFEKQRLYTDMHDRLTSNDSQRGRWVLFNRMGTENEIQRMFDRQHKNDDFNTVNRAIGLYNTLGIYAYRGFIDREIALDHWAAPVSQRWPDIERFLRWRRRTHGDPHMWPYLVWFAKESGVELSPEFRLQPGWDARDKPASPSGSA